MTDRRDVEGVGTAGHSVVERILMLMALKPDSGRHDARVGPDQ